MLAQIDDKKKTGANNDEIANCKYFPFVLFVVFNFFHLIPDISSTFSEQKLMEKAKSDAELNAKLAKEKNEEINLMEMLQRMIGRPENEEFLASTFLAIMQVPAIKVAIKKEFAQLLKATPNSVFRPKQHGWPKEKKQKNDSATTTNSRSVSVDPNAGGASNQFSGNENGFVPTIGNGYGPPPGFGIMPPHGVVQPVGVGFRQVAPGYGYSPSPVFHFGHPGGQNFGQHVSRDFGQPGGRGLGPPGPPVGRDSGPPGPPVGRNSGPQGPPVGRDFNQHVGRDFGQADGRDFGNPVGDQTDANNYNRQY
jgi:hypothetical protein